MYKYNIVRSPYDTSTISGDLTNYLYKFAMNRWYQQKIIITKIGKKKHEKCKNEITTNYLCQFHDDKPALARHESSRFRQDYFRISIHSST